MFPWLWIHFAPHYRFPWGGDWAQSIDPDNVFNTLVPPGAGVSSIEREATRVASYGSQLGWITDVLLAADPEAAVAPADAERARRKLREARTAIEDIKRRRKADLQRDAQAALARLREADPAAFEALLAQARPQVRLG